MSETVLNMPLVSVIIPCYNCGSFLEETLRSVFVQTYTNWECIIVDNGSTDNSSEIAKDFVKRDPRFHYLVQENKGVSAARNMGITTSKGKYILPLDGDDKISAHYMEKSIPILEKEPNVKVVYCEAELFADSTGKWKLPDFSIRNLLIENVVFCTAFFRRADFDKTKGYDETMDIGFEDWDFWLRFLGEGGAVYKIPEVHFYYRIRSKSRNNQLDLEKQKMLRRRIYQNHVTLYEKYLNPSDVIFELYSTQNSLRSIQRSGKYKFGSLVLAPLYFIKRLFKS